MRPPFILALPLTLLLAACPPGQKTHFHNNSGHDLVVRMEGRDLAWRHGETLHFTDGGAGVRCEPRCHRTTELVDAPAVSLDFGVLDINVFELVGADGGCRRYTPIFRAYAPEYNAEHAWVHGLSLQLEPDNVVYIAPPSAQFPVPANVLRPQFAIAPSPCEGYAAPP